MQDFAIIVPTLNAGPLWKQWLDALDSQTLQPSKRLLIDSGSDDQTAFLAADAGFNVIKIDKADFDHGGTRQFAADHLSDVPILVYLTQDAIFANAHALHSLVSAFDDPSVGIAYGRQLPRKEADPIEAHARLFNYPSASHMRSMEDSHRMGIKTAFTSNSFAAYRHVALDAAGGFPKNQIVSEDSIACAKALLCGWKVAYAAKAKVTHSHGYGIHQEFRRYFDIGVSHARNRDIIRKFGRSEGEGIRYVRSELWFLTRSAPHLIPNALMRSATKYLAYRIGLHEAALPMKVKRSLSMHPSYWQAETSPIPKRPIP